jgi:hypothetical protein
MPKMKLPNPFEYDVITMRGIIIAGTIEVERKMDDFLSSHFCASIDRKNELCELLFFTERITFELKKQMVFALLDTDLYKGFKKQNDNFVQNLEDITPYRNVLAHLEIEIDKCESIDTPLGTEITKLVFKRFKNGKYKPAVYPIQELNNLSEKMALTIIGFNTLITTIPPSELTTAQ